jgi:hypothetical protein
MPKAEFHSDEYIMEIPETQAGWREARNETKPTVVAGYQPALHRQPTGQRF